MVNIYSIRRSVKSRTSAITEILLDVEDVYLLLDYDPDQGILQALEEALLEHGCCAGCGAPVQHDFSECDCGIVPDTLPWYRFAEGNSLRVERHIWNNVLAPLWKKDKKRAYGITSSDRRKLSIQASDEPNYTSKDKACLREAQGNTCYYCGTSIETGAHVDHLEPLAHGGTNGFANIMLACASCNNSKHAKSERQFWQKLQKELPAEEFDRRRSAAKKMKKAKWRVRRERLREARKPRFEI